MLSGAAVCAGSFFYDRAIAEVKGEGESGAYTHFEPLACATLLVDCDNFYTIVTQSEFLNLEFFPLIVATIYGTFAVGDEKFYATTINASEGGCINRRCRGVVYAERGEGCTVFKGFSTDFFEAATQPYLFEGVTVSEHPFGEFREVVGGIDIYELGAIGKNVFAQCFDIRFNKNHRK